MSIREKIKKPFNRIKKLAHGVASVKPSSSSINDHGQSNAPEPVDANPVSPSPGPKDLLAPSTERSAGETAWATLKTSIGLLQASVSAFGPLKSAVEEISQCIEIFQRAAQNRKDYGTLATELASICKELSGYLSGSTPPVITSSIESLAKGIEREIKFVADKEKRSKGKRFVEAMDDPEEVLQCYSRIQRLLERLARNANMDIWRIVDEQVTTNRLKSLPYSPAAKYLSAESANLRGKGCTENTRVDVLETLRDWAYKDQSQNIYWLNGMAGTGKTTIADSLCAQLESTCTLAASFFCSRQLRTCNDVNRILPSIPYQLALFSPPFRHALSRILERNPEAHNQLLPKQFDQLIAEPLRQVEDTIPNALVVVIDALDECVDQNGVDQVLETLLSHASNLPIKFFVTSRPESKIRDRMLNPDDEQIRSVLHLHDLERSVVQEDIRTYLQVKLKRINLPPADLERLVERSGVLFIYAATLVRYIEADNFSRWVERLKLVLGTSTLSPSKKDKPIDELYSTILHAAFDDTGLEEHEKDEMKRVLRTVVRAQEQLTVDVMAGLLGLDAANSVRPALRPLFSVLHVSETSGLVTTLHQSFPDYVFHQGRSEEFYCDKHRHNALLAERCFSLIGTPDPPFNICGLESSYLFDEDVPNLSEKIEKAISPELFYACRYWGTHLELAETSERLVDVFREFLSLRLLLWMEALNLKRCMHDGGSGLQRVQLWSQASCPLDIQQLVRDAWGFVTAFSSSPASRSTPHIYISALPFWPEQRPVSRYYSDKMRLPKATGTAMRRESAPLAICVAPNQVNTVACSFDGARIVSGSSDKTIRIWDAHTGKLIGEPLEGHTSEVTSVAYSPDSTRIISGSWDMTIRIWDAHTGKTIGEPLEGHTSRVLAVAYSPDDARIVSGSADNTIRIWDLHTGKTIGEPLEGHTSAVLSVAYSPDGACIVSGSSDKTIRMWDARTGKMIGEPLKGHTNAVLSVAYSSDGAFFVSGSEDDTIRVWDAHTGKMIGEPLEGHTKPVASVAYSSDSTRIVSGSWDKTIRIWDAHTGKPIGEPLEGHTKFATSVAHSSDSTRIISGSEDKTIRIWDAHASMMVGKPLEGHNDLVKSVAHSSNGTHIVSGSQDKITRIWDAHTGQMIGKPFEGHTGAVMSVAYSSDGAHIISGSWDKTIRIWNADTGKMIGEPLEGHTNTVSSVVCSSDSRRIVSGSWDNTMQIWDVHTSKTIGEPLVGHLKPISSVSYSSDGTRVVSGSQDKTIRIWDAHTGTMVGEPLEGHTKPVTSVAYSSDGTRIVSGSQDKTIRIWDVHTGMMIGEPLEGHTQLVSSVAYSSDGTFIISGSWDKTIRIWDAHTGKAIGKPLEGHTKPVTSVAYSSDSTHIVSGSDDKTIRIWDADTNKSIDASLKGHSGSVTSVMHSSDGGCVANLGYRPEDPRNTWVLDKDGYMLANSSKLLMWVPADVRDILLRPQNAAIISAQGSVKVDFANAWVGDSWTQCYQST